MNNNIYLELELFLDPAITDAVALKNHLEQKISEWNKMVNASPKFKQKVAKAREFIQKGLTDLPQQANEARQTRLTTLRENITELSYGGEIKQFEIDYLKRHFTCFNEETIRNEIANHLRSITSGVSGIINAETNFSWHEILIQSGLGKLIGVVLLLLILLYPASYIPGLVAGLFQSLPNISDSQSYHRGVGSYVNRYANRSYNKAKWEIVWSTVNTQKNNASVVAREPVVPPVVSVEIGKPFEVVGDSLSAISGWDKDNLTITNNKYCLSLKDGQWHVNRDEPCKERVRPYYLSKDSFMLYGRTVKVYNQTSYSEFNDAYFTADTSFLNLFQPEKDLICLVGYDRHGNQRRYYEYNNHKFAAISSNENKFWIWKTNNVKTNSGMNELKLVHSFKDGSAIGCYKDWWVITPLFIAKYENGLWYELHKTTHTGDIYSLWAVDENNFIFAGEGITQFRDGIETHPIINVSGWSFGKNWLAVWGVDMNKWWAMDFQGNIVQFENDKFHGVIHGPQLNTTFQDAWVSPEGVVYAITREDVYRLD
jgi:hypothetical protein